MELISLNQIPKEALHSIVAIGNFDGVHLGHKRVINRAREISETQKKKLSIITFEPHPKCFFKKEFKNFRITPFRKKFEEIKKLRVDYYFNFKFSQKFSEISAEEFIEDILIKKMKVSYLITGFDFVFGHKQSGTIELLNKYSIKSSGFSFISVDEFKKQNVRKVSSSEIRTFLKKGNLSEAKQILGRDWSIISRVVRGKGIGKSLGFPTANLFINNYSELKYGVYAVEIHFKSYLNNCFFGIANYGIKPTFSKSEPILEIHIFDFDKNIYSELIEVTFKFFIREERQFENIEQLKSQISNDILNCKRYFNEKSLTNN